MRAKDRDGLPVLFYVTDPDVQTATGLREATAQDHVDVLIAKGGEIAETRPFGGKGLIEVEEPGRYLIYGPIRVESPEVPT